MRMLRSRKVLTWRERGSEPQAAWGGHYVMTVGRGHSLPMSSWLLLQGRCCSSWKGLRRVRVSSKYLVTDRVGLISSCLAKEILMRCWACMDRKLFLTSWHSWQPMSPGSCLGPSSVPSATMRKFQGCCVASCYFMLRSSPCRCHSRSYSSEK